MRAVNSQPLPTLNRRCDPCLSIALVMTVGALACGGATKQTRQASISAPPAPESQQHLVAGSTPLARAESLMERGDFSAAIEVLEHAVTLEDAEARSWFQLGYCYEQVRRDEEALRAYRQAIARQPAFAQAHNNLGRLQLVAGSAGEATASFRAALRIDPSSRSARENLALALEDAEQFEEAEAAYREAVAGDLENGRLRTNYAVFLANRFAESRRDEALREFRAALAHIREDTDLLVTIGNGLRQLGSHRDARRALERAMARMRVEGNGTVPASVLSEAALAELGCENPAGAVELLLEAIRSEPDHVVAYYLLGRVRDRQGEQGQARRAFREYLSRAPNGEHAQVIQRYLAASD